MITTLMGDCLDLLKTVPSNSIDLILTDLPYGVLNKGNPTTKWDCPIDMGRLWTEYLRVAKERAPIILFAQGMFTANLMMSQPKIWRYNLIWEKDRPTGFLNANRMPLRSHEDICVFYRKLPIYHPQMQPCLPSERNHPTGSGEHTLRNRHYGKFDRAVNPVIADVKHPRSIIKIPQEHKCDGKNHPTQKPVALLEWLIRTYTDEGNVVLDSCMGSGSTAIACIKTGRSFIGMELDESYYRLALERIAAVPGSPPTHSRA